MQWRIYGGGGGTPSGTFGGGGSIAMPTDFSAIQPCNVVIFYRDLFYRGAYRPKNF